MHILGKLKAKSREELNVLGQAGEPFLTANNVCSAHKVIVYRVCEVVGRNSVRLEKNEVLVILGNLKSALNKVGELYLLLYITESEDTKHEGVTRLDMLLNLFDSEVAASEHLPALSLSLCLPVGVLYFFFLIYCL